MSGPGNYNQQVIETFRANGGKVPGRDRLLLLTTTGARSGKEFTTPLAWSGDAKAPVIVASKGGAPTNPDWYFNLVAHPVATVEMGGERYQARARVTEGEERARLWADHVALLPGFKDYETKTERVLPVIVLERIAE